MSEFPDIAGQWIGLNKSLGNVEDLRQAWQRNALRRGVRAGANIVLAAEKSMLHSHRTGLLAAALGMKVSSKSRTHVSAAIGARRGFGQAGSLGEVWFRMTSKKEARETRGLQVEGTQFFDPVRYAHLVEKGRKEVTLKTKKVLYSAAMHEFLGLRAAAVEAKPFMAPAGEQSRPAVKAAIERDLRIEVLRRGV
jgi:hypothetical protein